MKRKQKTQPNEMINERPRNIKKPLFLKCIVALSFFLFQTKYSSSPTNLRRPSPTEKYSTCHHMRIWNGRSRMQIWIRKLSIWWCTSLYWRRMRWRCAIRREWFLWQNETFNCWSIRLRSWYRAWWWWMWWSLMIFCIWRFCEFGFRWWRL